MRTWLAFYLIFSFACVSSASSTKGSGASKNSIQKLKDVLEYGRHRKFQLSNVGREPQAWLSQYLDVMYEDLAADFEIKKELNDVIADQMLAGFPNEQVLASIEQIASDHMALLYAYQDPKALAQRQGLLAKYLKLILDNPEYEFGLDGFMQNACAGPTVYLLIYIPKTKVVHGIDLTPCTES